MKLGISMNFKHSSPEEWAIKHRDAGLESVVFPCDYKASTALIDGYVKAAAEAGLCIAEVGAWCNPIAPDGAEAKKNILHCQKSLELAEYVKANCCVNISGAAGEYWDGGYAANYTPETYEKTVNSIREIIDFVKPVSSCYAIEPMPYIIPDSPESYLKLLRDVDRKGLAVHLDAVNMINSPDRYFNNRDFVSHCFDLLGGKIRSCHVKDSFLEHALTLSIREVECGKGGFDIAHYISVANRSDENLPMIIEHLPDPEAYFRAITYIKSLV